MLKSQISESHWHSARVSGSSNHPLADPEGGGGGGGGGQWVLTPSEKSPKI